MGMPPPPKQDLAAVAAEKRLHNILMRSKSVAALTEDAREEEISRELKGCSYEDLRVMLETLDHHVTLHKDRGGCEGEDCELLSYCDSIRALLEKRMNLQLS